MRTALAALLLLAPAVASEGVKPPAPDLVTRAEALLKARYAADGPGAAVLVTRNGKPLFRKGAGLASVELGTPVKPGMVFRIGSVTKQFAAAAVLTLVEDGKVDLAAPLSRYLPDTPKAWEGVTVEMLLNHTSGIPSYTSDPTFDSHAREDFTPERLLETFVKAKSLDFQPGADHRYNNSGYFLAGLLIEKVTGKTWDAYLQTRFFEPLGMKHTRLGTETDLIPGLVQGYARGPKPSPYLSMTQPGAAGALVSTVDDLATWTLALHDGKVLKPASLARMLTATKTADGKTHPYGYGLFFRASQGRRLVGHGGGINGFVCMVEADPATRSVAVVLNNTNSPKGSDAYLTRRLLALAGGAPLPEPKAVSLPEAQLRRLEGRYKGPEVNRTITFEAGHLFMQAATGPKVELIPLSATRFAVKDVDLTLRFVLDGDQVKGFHRTDTEEPEGPLQPRLSEKDEPKAAALDSAAFDTCAGTFELAPGFQIRFWREGDKLYTQATGQGRAELFSENALTYFLKIVEAKVVFEKDADGKVTKGTLHQGGQALPLKRVK